MHSSPCRYHRPEAVRVLFRMVKEPKTIARIFSDASDSALFYSVWLPGVRSSQLRRSGHRIETNLFSESTNKTTDFIRHHNWVGVRRSK